MKTAVFDLEANGLHDATTIWCIVIKDLGTGDVQKFGPSSIERGVRVLGSYDTLIGHNIIDFDSSLIGRLYSPLNCSLWDTLVCSRLLYPDRPDGHSLGAWGERLGRGKPAHEDWTQFTEEMMHRCVEDVEINTLLYHELHREMEGHDWTQALELEFNVQRIISEQARNGVLFDTNLAEKSIQELTAWIEEIDHELEEVTPSRTRRHGVDILEPFKKDGSFKKVVVDWFMDTDLCNLEHPCVAGPFSRVYFERLNLASDVQLKELLFSLGWKPTQWNFNKETGERTSPKLEFHEGDGLDSGLGKLIKDRKLWSHRRSQIQGWLDKVRDDGRLPAGANTIGTPTRRFRHNTVVNVPKAGYNKEGGELAAYGNRMRSLFTVPEGCKLIGYDASGLELRMLAHFMNDDKYTEILLNDDIHEYNRQLIGLPERDDAKTFIYAFNYGAGDGKIGSIIGGSASDGARLKREFFEGLPSLERLIKGVKRAAGRGYLVGVDGGFLRIRRGSDGRLQLNKALNTLLQGTGAIVMKQSMVFMDQWVKERGLDAKKVIDMHDEAQWEVAEKDVEEFMELAPQCIVRAGEHFNLNIPLAAEAKVGMTWAETH